MLRHFAGLAVLSALAAVASAAAAQTCLKADDKAEAVITGNLATVNFIHPGNRSRQTAYVVNLARPLCADVTDIDDKVRRVANIRRVQLAGDLDAAKLRQLVGKRVSARGTLFGQHTAYHIAPILVSLKALDAAK